MTSSNEKSQWDCLRENIGVWRGAFRQFSPDGELVKDTPSVLTLKEEKEQTLTLTLERMPEGEPKKINNLTFEYPGPAPYTYFFESGAFSQGSSQWSSFGQFVTEFSIKVGDRRIRFVVAYDSTQRYTSALKYVTLICETQSGGTQFASRTLAVKQISGLWEGAGEVLDPIAASFSKKNNIQWKLDNLSDHGLSLHCKEQIGEEQANEDGYSVNLISEEGSPDQNVITFKNKDDSQVYQLMLLPEGAYCFLPTEIRQNSEFRIEVGWVSEEGKRSRFIRYYDSRGVWTHSALINDTHS